MLTALPADERRTVTGGRIVVPGRLRDLAVFGIGLGALIRSQIGATVTATVLHLAGATAAGTVFELLNTYVITSSWILSAQVIVPSVASAVMISPTKTFAESPAQWVGALVLIGYGVVAGVVGTRLIRRRDIA